MEVKCKGNTQITHMEETKKRHRVIRLCPNVSTTRLWQWGFRQCLPFSWTTLRGKHCRRHPIAVMGVLDTFGLWSRLYCFPTDFYMKRALPRMVVMITLLPSFFLSDMVKTSLLLHLHKFWRALDQSDQIMSC